MMFSLLINIMLWCVFFFKQKTAYELRISDWSSDVCSSDLLVVLNGCAGKGFAHRACQCPNFLDGMGTGNEARLFNGRGDEESPLQKGLVQCGEKSRIQIGRAHV